MEPKYHFLVATGALLRPLFCVGLVPARSTSCNREGIHKEFCLPRILEAWPQVGSFWRWDLGKQVLRTLPSRVGLVPSFIQGSPVTDRCLMGGQRVRFPSLHATSSSASWISQPPELSSKCQVFFFYKPRKARRLVSSPLPETRSTPSLGRRLAGEMSF